MMKKSLACGVVGAFAFVLITTAWDYCRPDPDKLLFEGKLSVSDSRIGKPHHPCASLKDVYDITSFLRIDQRSDRSFFNDVILDFIPASFKENSENFHGLSPPFESPPAQTFPIFLRVCNLRL